MQELGSMNGCWCSECMLLSEAQKMVDKKVSDTFVESCSSASREKTGKASVLQHVF